MDDGHSRGTTSSRTDSAAEQATSSSSAGDIGAGGIFGSTRIVEVDTSDLGGPSSSSFSTTSTRKNKDGKEYGMVAPIPSSVSSSGGAKTKAGEELKGAVD